MSVKDWEAKVLRTEGAAKRVAEIEDELRLAAGLTALRERAGMTQRELAETMGVSQPRIAQIEKSKNVTIDVLDAYVSALGGHLEVNVLRAGRRTKILGAPPKAASVPQRFNALNVKNRRGTDSAESTEKAPESTQASGVKPPRKTRNTAVQR